MTASIAETRFSLNYPATDTHTADLPASAVEGDVVLVGVRGIFGFNGVTFPAGSFELDDSGSNAIAVKKLTAADITAGSLTITSTTARPSRCTVTLLNDCPDPADLLPEVSAFANGADANPDTSSVSPSGGLRPYLVVSWIGWSDTVTDRAVTAYPTDYDHHQETAGDVTIGAAVAARQLTTSLEDPNQWTLSGIPAISWSGWTIAFYTKLEPDAALISDVRSSELLKTADPDPFLIGDAATTEVTRALYERTVVDGILLDDQASTIAEHKVIVSDTFFFMDTLVEGVIRGVVTTVGILFEDHRLLEQYHTFQDPFLFIDVVTAEAGSFVTEADQLLLSDAATTEAEHISSQTDEVLLGDTATTEAEHTTSEVDQFLLGDVVSAVVVQVTAEGDQVLVADTTTLVAQLDRQQDEPILVDDATVLAVEASRDTDPLGVSDEAFIQVERELLVSDESLFFSDESLFHRPVTIEEQVVFDDQLRLEHDLLLSLDSLFMYDTATATVVTVEFAEGFTVSLKGSKTVNVSLTGKQEAAVLKGKRPSVDLTGKT